MNENGIFLLIICHYWRGRLCEVAYTNAQLPPFKLCFTPIIGGGGGGAWAFVPLRYASDSGAARICRREGAKARERSDRAGEGVGRSPPMVYFYFILYFYREFVKNRL